MKKLFLINFFLLNFIIGFSQNNVKTGILKESDYNEMIRFLKEKNIATKDTVFIKYDFNRETCWDSLDEMSEDHIKKVLQNFQENIINFNKDHKGAIAVNFREPGNSINKLKKWDKTIIIDEKKIIKKIFFKEKQICGNSIILFSDKSYAILYGDPHFDLLNLLYKNNKSHKF